MVRAIPLRAYLLVPLFLSLALCSGPARGQERPSAPNDKSDESEAAGEDLDQVVQQHVDQGARAFQARRYPEAAAEFKAAYELDPQPRFLFHLGRACHKARRFREAAAAYDQFLREEPGTPLRAETIGYQRDLLRQQQQEQERKKPLWKKGWFWGVIGGVTAAVALGVGIGLAVGLRGSSVQ